MAISTTFEQIKSKYDPRFGTLEEFEEYYLQRLAETLPDRNYYTNRNGVETPIDSVNHHPELKTYEVWCEGYAATGESGGAHLMGTAKARCFAQACHIVMCEKYLQNAEDGNAPNYKGYAPAGRWDYDPTHLRYWACGLFWSEALAKKSFG